MTADKDSIGIYTMFNALGVATSYFMMSLTIYDAP